ncbi:MAG: radical SAM protein [Acidobacteriota bacterium]
MSPLPEDAPGRDQFILARRGPRTPPDPWAAPRMVIEDERAADGSITSVAAIFLAGKECPWRCTMCDLWRDTLETDTPHGAIPRQLEGTWPHRPDSCTTVKLYNAGSFFDPHAVPDDDYVGIVDALRGVRHVIVESHPSLIGLRTMRLRDLLRTRAVTESGPPTLEVAMGLETCHPSALERLNKRMTTADFARAAERLKENDVTLRVFLLISPPFVPAAEQDEWLTRSIDFAITCGATAISMIPTRAGNGALEALADEHAFAEPQLADVERSLALALARVEGSRTRVFADLWDLARFAPCGSCAGPRQARLTIMNRTQVSGVPITPCQDCGAGGAV